MLSQVIERLRSARKVELFSHARPDGDAVGSLLGLGLALEEQGKSIAMVLADGVPVNFSHLPGAERVVHRSDMDPDLQIVLDCSDLSRVGDAIQDIRHADINIDHHVTNTRFAELNLVHPQAVSTTEIIYDLLSAADVTISAQAASGLVTGLITDTLGFMTPNITARAMRIAADLMEHGADLPTLYRKAMVEKSFEALKFWGAGLRLLERENNLVWTSLTMEDRSQAGYYGRDDADLINQLSSIKEGDVRLIFVEQSPHQVKVSWRSGPQYDVSSVAARFGGGGHPTASGAMIEGPLDQVRGEVLEATRNLVLNGDGNGSR
jgi:phosphoesterase RecJ-like protein